MFNKFKNQGPAGQKPRQPKVKEARGSMSKFTFVLALVLGGIFLLGAVFATYNFIDGIGATNRAVEIQAQAELARVQADMYRGQAEMYKGLSEAYRTEADKWRGYGAAVSAWAEPLGVLPKTLGAIALILVAAGTALGVGRLLWGLGRSGEVYVAARVRVAERQAEFLLEQQRRTALPQPQVAVLPSGVSTVQPRKEHRYDPSAGVPKFLEGRASQEVEGGPETTQK